MLPLSTLDLAFVPAIGRPESVRGSRYTEIGVNELDQAWCRGNLRCHNDMHSQL